jgi:hypothetical protein
MPIVNVGETDKVSIAVIGLNEGLPYLAGGGGFGMGNKATIEGTEELLKTMAEKAAKARLKGADLVANPAISVAFELLKNYIEELNSAADCRGVAFAFEAELTH